VEGVRFEVPSAYRTLRHVPLRVARWNLSSVDRVDPRTGQELARLVPLAKVKNADRAPRARTRRDTAHAFKKRAGIAPLLCELRAEYATTGLPPAYLPKNRPADSDEED
jgi:putative transposase